MNENPRAYSVAYSNKATVGGGAARIVEGAVFWDEAGRPGAPTRTAVVFVILAPGEVQILTHP